MQLLLSPEISLAYWVGAVLGMLVLMFYNYARKHNLDPHIVFDKKYLVPFFSGVVVLLIQFAFELIAIPIPYSFATPLDAFIFAFVLFSGIQEIIKAILKNPKVTYL